MTPKYRLGCLVCTGIVAAALICLVASSALALEKHRQVQLFAAPVTFDSGATIEGKIILRPVDGAPILFKTQAPTTDTTSTDMTEAELLGGLHEKTPSAAQDWQVPTGAEISAAVGSDLAVGDSFLFRLVNLGGDGDTVTLITAASGTTMVGNMAVTSTSEVGLDLAGWAVFLVRNSGAGTWVFYRIG